MNEEVNKLIVKQLKTTNIPCFFIQKPEDLKLSDYITFSYYEDEDWFSNDSNELCRYTVSLRYITSDQTNLLTSYKIIKDSFNLDNVYRFGQIGTVYDEKAKVFKLMCSFELIMYEAE